MPPLSKTRLVPARPPRRSTRPALESMEPRLLLSTFTVTKTGDDGSPGTFRWAIQQSNGNGGANSIDFNIPGLGVRPISLGRALPQINTPTNIDGTSQPGYQGTPLIELDGSNAGIGVDGLVLSAGNSSVQGLAINRFAGAGIKIQNAGNNLIQADYIGTDPSGNLAEGNASDGILITFGANNNQIVANVISANAGNGANLDGNGGANNPGTSGNVFRGNLIGTNAAGISPLPNRISGINLANAPFTQIGGPTPAARNILSGNANHGVLLGSGSDHTIIQGNNIGTDITGSFAVPNGNDGVIYAGASFTLIGGSSPGEGNLISGNAANGIDSFVIGATNELIQGNLIGTDAKGAKPIPNGVNGIKISGPSVVSIGGILPTERNVISGNTAAGILAQSPKLDIIGNLIGTDITGSKPLGNGGPGIDVSQGPTFIGALNQNDPPFSSNTGSLPFYVPNTIAFNGAAQNAPGVRVSSTNVSLWGNAIFANANQGILTNSTAVAPVVTSAVSTGNSSQVSVSITAAVPNGSEEIELFASPSADPATHFEGQIFLGAFSLPNDPAGNASATHASLAPIPPGWFVTATSTSLSDLSPSTYQWGETSPFSNAVAATGTYNGITNFALTGSASATSLLAGQNITYSFTITPSGPATPFVDGHLDIPIPQGATLVAAFDSMGQPVLPGSALVEPNVVGFNVAVNTPHVQTFRIVLATNAAAIPSLAVTAYFVPVPMDANAADNTTTLTTTVASSTDLAVSMTGPTSALKVGDTVSYTLNAHNNGPNTAAAVLLTDTLPAGVSLVSATPSSGPPVSINNGVITDHFGNLAPGASFSLVIVATLGAGAVPTLTNTASISSAGPDSDPSNNTASNTVSVTPVANLGVTITSPSAPVLVGDNLQYTVKATNAGPSPATNVILLDTLPANVTFLSALADSGPAPTQSAGIVTDTIGNLASGASVNLTILVKPTAAAAPSATNSATVSALEFDPNTLNNSASSTTDVIPVADLAISSLTASSNSVLLGQNITYTIQVANNGPQDAPSVLLTDPLPPGLTFVSGTSSLGAISASGRSVTASLGTLPNGASATITIIASTSLPALGSVTNTVSLAANAFDPTPADNTRSVNTTVSPAADLQLRLSATPSPAFVVQNLQYIATITNAGLSPATGVTFTNPLPANVTYVSATVSIPGVTPIVDLGVVFASLGTLAPGATATLTIIVTPTLAAVGTLADYASTSAIEPNPNPADASATVFSTVLPLANLTVSMTASAPQVTVGDPLSYTINIINPGPSPATAVTLHDPLPAGFAFTSATCSQGSSTFDNASSTLTALLGSLAPGASASLLLQLVATQPGSMVNTATALAVESHNPTNNSATVTTNVVTGPGGFAFLRPKYAVYETDGYAGITINRLDGAQGVVSVHFSTLPGGGATPGVDYTPVSQVVTFAQGVTSQNVRLPVFRNPYDNHNETVALQLDSPTGGATLAAPVQSTLFIIDTDPDLTGPTVNEIREVGPANAITGLILQFSEPLNPQTAANPSNYLILSTATNGRLGFGTQSIPIGSVSYNPSTFTVLVVPAIPLKPNTFYWLNVNGTHPGALTDLAGNPLNSTANVTPGHDYGLYVSRGANLAYTDDQGAKVTLRISGGGVLDLTRDFNGKGLRLQVLNAVPYRTSISGTVKYRPSTSFHQILGLGSFGAIKTDLTQTPPFFVDTPVFPNSQLPNPPAIDIVLGSPTPTIAAASLPKGPKLRAASLLPR